MPRSTQTIAGVERALDVIALFAESGASDLGVTEIAEELDLSKAVVHRILSSFRTKGFVELDPDTRRYRIGARALTVGLSYLNRIDQVEIVRAALEELADTTGETATQSVRAGSEAVYVSQVPSRRKVRVVVELGASFPLHVGSASRVLLAHADEETRASYLAERGTDELADDLEQVRARGYAEALGERERGVGELSAPVRDHTAGALAALTVYAPEERFRRERDDHLERLMTIAEDVSRSLGFIDLRDGGRAASQVGATTGA